MMASNGFTSLFLLLLLMQQVFTWNSEKPIYKWSPVWFNYRTYLEKRYNEDKPIYKWSPYWLNKYGRKRAELNLCALEMAPCDNPRFSSLGIFMNLPCCEGLRCTSVGNQFLCQQTSELEDLEVDK